MIPSLRYKSKPNFATQTSLKETLRYNKIKSENLANELQNHKDIVGRIQDKEDASFRIREFKKDNPTFADKIDGFKKDNLKHFSQTFGNITIGVHGKELPKFQKNNKEWWKSAKGYNQSPNYQSAIHMSEDKNEFKVRVNMFI